MPKKEIPKIYEEIGKKIKKLRESKNLSQMDVAYKASLSLSALSCIERAVKKLNIDTLERLSKVLGVHITYFFK